MQVRGPLESVSEGPATLPAALAALADDDPSRPTTIFRTRSDEVVVRRRELADLSAAHAASLADAGVVPGDRVVIAWPTSKEFLGAFWGCQLLGAVAVPAPTPRGGRNVVELRRLRAIIEHAGPAAVSASGETGELIASSGSTAVVVSAGARNVRWNGDMHRALPTDPAVVQYTSGSTTDPRGCVLTHAAITANLTQIALRFGVDHRMHGVNWCPLYHDMGLVGSVLLPVWSRDAVAVLMPPEDFILNPVGWLRAMAHYRAEISSAPSSAFALLAKRLRRGDLDLDLSSVRSIVCGAEPIHAPALRSFSSGVRACGFSDRAIQPGYGLAEHVVLISSRPAGVRTEVIRRDELGAGTAVPVAEGASGLELVSLGHAIQGCDLRVVRPDGFELPERSVGEVEARSASTMSGYHNDPEATAKVFRGEWLRTGDIGYLADGELFLTGRSKDVVITGGRNIFCFDVEQVVSEMDGIRFGAAVAFAVPSADGGEDLAVVVEARPAQREGVLASVRSACGAHLGVVPRHVVAIPTGTLPRTSSGKLQRNVVRALFLDGELGTRAKAE